MATVIKKVINAMRHKSECAAFLYVEENMIYHAKAWRSRAGIIRNETAAETEPKLHPNKCEKRKQ